MVPAVVLAAGASSRMGRPKALLPIDATGSTFLARILATLASAGVDDVLVVVGVWAEAIAAELGDPGPRVRLIGNPDPARGQVSSILTALDCVDRPGVDGLLVSLVDMPLVTAATVRAVLERHRRTRAPIVRPIWGSRHGHPVLFDRRVFDELRQADAAAGAKTVVRAHAGDTEEVPVEDEGAFIDIDTPDDYRRFIGPYLDWSGTDRAVPPRGDVLVADGSTLVRRPDRATLAGLASVLAAVLGDRVTTAAAVREHHSHGESYHPASAPDIVCFPMSTDEVSAVVRACAAARVPMVPFGAGTSLEGHVAALHGGVTIDLSRMTRVVRVSPDDLDATVEAGVTHSQLNHALRNTGLFFPIDPGADATLGGMAATRASGTTAVRYGTMRDNVMGMTVVLADGRVISTGGRARKSAAGYDLTRLFVGSEGTLGVITEVTLRLYGRPEATAAAVCAFAALDGAVQTVISTIQLGIPVARIELLDEVQMDAVNRYSRLEYPVAPTLFFEFHGTSESSVSEQARAVQELASERGGTGFRWATTPEERARLWHARHNAYYAALALRPGSRGWTTDVCVPISRLAECILETKRDNEQSFLLAPLVGHAGDGNFHLIYLVNPDDAADLAEAARLNDRLVARALALGGTCTGEHGVGFGKMHALEQEHGPALSVMRSIKEALDPHNLMNPAKVVDTGS